MLLTNNGFTNGFKVVNFPFAPIQEPVAKPLLISYGFKNGLFNNALKMRPNSLLNPLLISNGITNGFPQQGFQQWVIQ